VTPVWTRPLSAPVNPVIQLLICISVDLLQVGSPTAGRNPLQMVNESPPRVSDELLNE